MDNIRKKLLANEYWENVEIQPLFAAKFKLEISNFGVARRTTIETSEVVILKQVITEGYAQAKFSIREKLSPTEKSAFEETRKILAALNQEIEDLKNKINFLNKTNAIPAELLENLNSKENEFKKLKRNFKSKYKKSENKRRQNFSNLIHRLVASKFLDKPSDEHNLVAHLDYNKLNNHFSNLKWMTREENVKHQLNSPFVIESKLKAATGNRITRSKLTTSQVATIKKRINEGVTLSVIAKRFPVTETQLLRIKRGINWSTIPAAL